MGLRVFNCNYCENNVEENSDDGEWNPYVIKYIELLLEDEEVSERTNEEKINDEEPIQFEKLSGSFEEEKGKEGKEGKEEKEEKREKKESKYTLITKRIDVNKIRHKTAKSTDVFASVLKNMSILNDGPIRSGAIVYTHYKGKTYFCLGVDTMYGDLTDFGGGVKKDETLIEGGLRELEEESLGIFGKISYKEVEDAMAIYSSNIIVMFIRRDVNMEEIKKNFLFKKGGRDTEVSNISWLEKKEFLDSINGKGGNKLYSRVKRILLKTIDIIAAL